MKVKVAKNIFRIRAQAMGVQTRLMGLIFLITLTNLLVMGVALYEVKKQEEDANILNRLGQQRTTVQQMAKEVMEIAHLPDVDQDYVRATLQLNYDLFEKTLDGMIGGNEAMGLVAVDDVGVMLQLQNVKVKWAEFGPRVQDIINQSKDSERFKVSRDFIQKNNLDLLEEVNQANFSYQTVAEQKVAFMNTLMVSGAVLTVVITLVISYLIFRMILRPILQTVEMIQALDEGNLDKRLNMNRNDEIGLMAKSLDQFADALKHEVVVAFDKLSTGDLTFEAKGVIREGLRNTNNSLNELLTEMRRVGENIADGSVQVANASSTLSQGATEQAASLQEINASINDLAGQTRHNAEAATQANQLALHAKMDAETGNHSMAEMVRAMSEITVSSQEISKIIKVIDEIAFQTNLLALNAAVEAGRAGRHGKGFAVVAGEVRNLAARSAKAAKETGQLIAGAVRKVRNGMEIAENTAATLEGISSGINKVNDLVSEIAQASNDQAMAISQISNALTQIERVTQQNTASAEQSAAAAQEQARNADIMRQMLSRFNLRRDIQQKAKTVVTLQRVTRPGGKTLPQSAAAPKTGDKGPGNVVFLNDKDFGKY